MSTDDWDAAERSMTPDEWADVFSAGAGAALARTELGLAAALRAMATECGNIERTRNSRHN